MLNFCCCHHDDSDVVIISNRMVPYKSISKFVFKQNAQLLVYIILCACVRERLMLVIRKSSV